MAVQRLNLRGSLLDPEDRSAVAQVSCYLVVRDLGHWQGSLTVLAEQRSIWREWFAGKREYLLELPGHGIGSVSLDPLEYLDPAARGSYTFRGLGPPPESIIALTLGHSQRERGITK